MLLVLCRHLMFQLRVALRCVISRDVVTQQVIADVPALVICVVIRVVQQAAPLAMILRQVLLVVQAMHLHYSRCYSRSK